RPASGYPATSARAAPDRIRALAAPAMRWLLPAFDILCRAADRTRRAPPPDRRPPPGSRADSPRSRHLRRRQTREAPRELHHRLRASACSRREPKLAAVLVENLLADGQSQARTPGFGAKRGEPRPVERTLEAASSVVHRHLHRQLAGEHGQLHGATARRGGLDGILHQVAECAAKLVGIGLHVHRRAPWGPGGPPGLWAGGGANAPPTRRHAPPPGG